MSLIELVKSKKKDVKNNSNYTIGIVPFPERGGYYPSFRLAKKLINMGYNVIYLGPPEFENEVSLQGIKYKVLFKDEYPEGTFDPAASNDRKGIFTDKINGIKQMIKDANAMFKAIDEGDIKKIIYENKIDLILVDALLPLVSLALIMTKITVINFATELISDSHKLPPNFSSLIPKKNSFISKFTIKLAWFFLWLSYRWEEIFGNIFMAIFKIKKIPKKYIKLWKKLKKESGLKHVFSEYIERPLLPEIVLCPKEFDFPYMDIKNERCYIGHNIDFDRKECSFPWNRLDDDKILIYCSLGTHVAIYKHANKFFKELIKAAQQLPEYQFVVSLGAGRSESDLIDKPDNMIGVVRTPQLAILKKAKLMITNGGLGTVKECIMHAVPMIVLPCMYDQPGNAARVTALNIGKMSKINKISSKKIKFLVESILKNKKYYNNINELKKIIEENDSFEKGINFIESKLKVFINK